MAENPHTKSPSPSIQSTSSEDNSANIRVIARVRPLNEKEKGFSQTLEKGQKDICVEFDQLDKKAITCYIETGKKEKPYEKHSFNFDYVLDPSTIQQDVFEKGTRPIIESVLEGFNGTVFAYGQTSSGKTFTMQGDIHSKEMMGVIHRMVQMAFERIGEASKKIEFTVKSSMVEIYNEKIKDLLDVSKDNLKIHEDKTKGVYIDDVTDRYNTSFEEVMSLMEEGNTNRSIAKTDMNAVSSRSHSIFIMTITQNDLENFSCKTGKLYLVDLAGSEKISKTGASGQTLEEAKNINKSLTMLGMVINSLTDGKSTHIPYRDSKLTRMLQESLGGNSKTCLIINCSPSMYNAVETLSNLRFGMRAKSIKNNAKINKQLTVGELKLIVKNLEKELAIKNKRIQVLEKTILDLGGTIPILGEEHILFDKGENEEESNQKSEDDDEEDKDEKSIQHRPELEEELKESQNIMSPIPQIEQNNNYQNFSKQFDIQGIQKTEANIQKTKVILEITKDLFPLDIYFEGKPKINLLPLEFTTHKSENAQISNMKPANVSISSEMKKNPEQIVANQASNDKKELIDQKFILSISNYSIPESDKSLLFSMIKQNQEMIRADKLKDLKIEIVKKEYILRNNELDKIQKELAVKRTELGSAKKENDLLIKLIAEMRIKVNTLEKSLKDHEKLAKEKEETLAFQSQIITSLQQQLDEVKAKLDLKYKGAINEKLATSNPGYANIDFIQLILQDSQLDSKSKEHIKKLIEQLNQPKSVSIISNQKPKEQKLSSIEEILEQRMKSERKKLEEEKSILIKDMEQKNQKMTEKENENEELKIKIKKLENIVNDGSHNKEQKIIQLQKHIDQVTKIYHQILGQVSSLKIEKQLIEKKFDRNNDRFKNMEKQIETLQAKLKLEHQINLELKQKYGEESDEALLNIRLSSDINLNSSISAPSNVVKKIMGGGGAKPEKAENKS